MTKRSLTAAAVIGERLYRQRLLHPIDVAEDPDAYEELFALLQPVAPVYFSRPGDPPTLVHRTVEPDYQHAHQRRERNEIVKGRFNGGRVAYVRHTELDVYARAFRKPLAKRLPIHDAILHALGTSGGLSKEQLKEQLDVERAGDITKALQTMQEAFLVYEHQPDTDWDTGWFLFETEWFALEEDAAADRAAMEAALDTFVRAMVFVTAAQIKSWSSWTQKTVQYVLASLVERGELVAVEVDGLGSGYVRADDASGVLMRDVPPAVWMLDKSDMLVRAQMDELKKRYSGLEVLQYLLIDGIFQGVVCGHWRIGPYEIDNVVVELTETEATARKEEIVAAVRHFYEPDTHPIRHYNGKPL